MKTVKIIHLQILKKVVVMPVLTDYGNEESVNENGFDENNESTLNTLKNKGLY